MHRDYLADTLLIGLKSIDETEVYEYPLNRFVYNDSDQKVLASSHGKGFTTACILDANEAKPVTLEEIGEISFDLTIFSAIHRQYSLIKTIRSKLNSSDIVFIDGEDHPGIFPYLGKYWRNGSFWSLPKVHKKYPYFKRELIEGEILKYMNFKILPIYILNFLHIKPNIREINFSIPDDKIVAVLPQKTKLFGQHIVDPEIASAVSAQTGYVFKNESDYYQDLQSSMYGITTKRAGWDCLRHYEIAANGSLICFKDLLKKPLRCAPHGLVPGYNCLSYSSWADLEQQISKLSVEKYRELQTNCWNWAKANTCRVVAEKFMLNFKKSNS